MAAPPVASKEGGHMSPTSFWGFLITVAAGLAVAIYIWRRK